MPNFSCVLYLRASLLCVCACVCAYSMGVLYAARGFRCCRQGGLVPCAWVTLLSSFVLGRYRTVLSSLQYSPPCSFPTLPRRDNTRTALVTQKNSRLQHRFSNKQCSVSTLSHSVNSSYSFGNEQFLVSVHRKNRNMKNRLCSSMNRKSIAEETRRGPLGQEFFQSSITLHQGKWQSALESTLLSRAFSKTRTGTSDGWPVFCVFQEAKTT